MKSAAMLKVGVIDGDDTNEYGANDIVDETNGVLTGDEAFNNACVTQS